MIKKDGYSILPVKQIYTSNVFILIVISGLSIICGAVRINVLQLHKAKSKFCKLVLINTYLNFKQFPATKLDK